VQQKGSLFDHLVGTGRSNVCSYRPAPTATLPARAYGLAVPRDGDLARIIGVRRLVTLATTTPVASAVSRVFAFSMQAERSIVVDPKSPGSINSPHGLILFDGVCVLCSRLQLREQT